MSESPAGTALPACPPLSLRRYSAMPPQVLVVGVSTGGPQALEMFLGGAAHWLGQIPVVIVIHLPPDFVRVVARHIETVVNVPCTIATNGEKVQRGTIYFAPGDRHLKLMRADRQVVLVHSDAPPQNFCKPAVDALFASAARSYGPEALGLVLTGMGRDGLAGARAIAEAGGSVIVQNEATSAVWGMPGAVARAGLASAVLPLGGIASAIGGLLAACHRGRSA